MWIRKRLDISARDLLWAAIQCALPGNRHDRLRGIASLFGPPDEVLPCLSVRSGFDLLLSALALPPESEVLLSALTIPDMVRLVEAHGLRAVPVDLNLDTAGPDPDKFRRALSPASRAVVVAHLFGGRLAMEPIVGVAREHGLRLIEDCAQAFDGPGYCGHPAADVSMFSFGPIKTATALGGAVLRVRDPALLRAMQERQAEWPVQRRSDYFGRLLTYMLFKFLSTWPAFDLLIGTSRLLGGDYDRLLNRSVRGFAGSDLLARIRTQPSAPLLSLLGRRLTRYDSERLARRAARGRLLVSLLAEHVRCPGRAMEPHNYWVFPILADDPHQMFAALRASGFDATQGQSMCVVQPPPDRPELSPCNAEAALAKMIYLPNYPEMPETAARRMAAAVIQAARA